MKTKKIIFLLILILNISVFGQDYNRYWYFGDKAGLDFGTNYGHATPLPLTSTLPAHWEGIATISTNSGVFVGYSNGVNLFDRNQVAMPNLVLAGSNDSAQSGIILPHPNKKYKCQFFVFSVSDAGQNKPLSWQKFELNSDASITAVTNTNQVAGADNVSERLYAYKAPNNTKNGYFIISTIKNTKIFKIGYIDETMENPTFYNLEVLDDTYNVASNQFGSVKVSPNGSYLALTGNGEGVRLFEIEYFNNAISKISFEKEIEGKAESTGDCNGWYGIEFSPNSENLFYTSAGFCGSNYNNNKKDQKARGIVKVYNLLSGDKKTLWNSFTENNWDFVYKVGAIQKAPGREELYVANPEQHFLGSILNPDSYTTTIYKHNYIKLSDGTKSLLGLPNQIYDNVQFGCKTIEKCTPPVITIKYRRAESKNNKIKTLQEKGKEILNKLGDKKNTTLPTATGEVKSCVEPGNQVVQVGEAINARYRLSNSTNIIAEGVVTNNEILLTNLITGTYEFVVTNNNDKQCQTILKFEVCDELPKDPPSCEVECCIPAALKLKSTYINETPTSIFYQESSRNTTKINYEPTTELIDLIDSYVLQMQSNLSIQKCTNKDNARFEIVYKLYNYTGTANPANATELDTLFTNNRSSFTLVGTINDFRTSAQFSYLFNGNYTCIVEVEMKWSGINTSSICNTTVFGGYRNFMLNARMLSNNGATRQFKKFSLQNKFSTLRN